MDKKLKLALYWASSCGGCDIATLAIGDKILELAKVADILLWPIAMDFKYSDVDKWPDKSIDVCLFNGAIRTSENEHMAQVLRAKSKILIAYGSCSYEGCIPGLANFFNRQLIFDRVYLETPSTDNPEKIYPQTKVQVPEGELELPEFYDTVKTLAQTVDVDYFVPGCPPEERTTWLALEALIENKLPPKGTVISHAVKSVCDECPRIKKEKKIKKFYRTYEIIPEPETCLLEQGIVCMGPATRGGCGAVCIQANMPCTGCYGPVEPGADQGARMISAIASVLGVDDEKDLSDEQVEKLMDQIVDPAGTFYRYSLPDSLLRRARIE